MKAGSEGGDWLQRAALWLRRAGAASGDVAAGGSPPSPSLAEPPQAPPGICAHPGLTPRPGLLRLLPRSSCPGWPACPVPPFRAPPQVYQAPPFIPRAALHPGTTEPSMGRTWYRARGTQESGSKPLRGEAGNKTSGGRVSSQKSQLRGRWVPHRTPPPAPCDTQASPPQTGTASAPAAHPAPCQCWVWRWG